MRKNDLPGLRKWKGEPLDIQSVPIGRAIELLEARKLWLEQELAGCSAILDRLRAALDPSLANSVAAKPEGRRTRTPAVRWAVEALKALGGKAHVDEITKEIARVHGDGSVNARNLGSALFKAAKRDPAALEFLGSNKFGLKGQAPPSSGTVKEAKHA